MVKIDENWHFSIWSPLSCSRSDDSKNVIYAYFIFWHFCGIWLGKCENLSKINISKYLPWALMMSQTGVRPDQSERWEHKRVPCAEFLPAWLQLFIEAIRLACACTRVLAHEIWTDWIHSWQRSGKRTKAKAMQSSLAQVWQAWVLTGLCLRICRKKLTKTKSDTHFNCLLQRFKSTTNCKLPNSKLPVHIH